MSLVPQILRTDEGADSIGCDAVLVGATSADGGVELSAAGRALDAALGEGLSDLLGSGFKARVGDVAVVPTLGRVPARTIAVVGLGSDPGPAEVRRAAAAAARKLPDASDVVTYLHEGVGEDSTTASLEGLVLAGYRFAGYGSSAPERTLKRLSVAGGDTPVLERATARIQAEVLARDLTNEPASVLTPSEFARRAEQVADVAGLEVEVLGPDRLEELGFGGILGVSRGSEEPPCLIVLRHEPEGASDHIALVGKGITFDSGGYSIKPAGSMERMKTDMAGAAAVLAVMGALGKLDVRTAVTGYLACSENLISGRAIKPGDVITHYGGRTTEVTNTDAEGRLVLGDAIAYAAEQDPTAIVDLATLTGGIHVALGDDVAGLFSNDDELAEELLGAAVKVGESLWRMPLIDRYERDYSSQVADMKNSGSRWGSPIKAALFLRAFVPGETKWAHLDIAGPARADSDRDEITKGGTGYGVRTILSWLEARSAR